MRAELLEILRCPVTGASLALSGAQMNGKEIEMGELSTPDGAHRYPIRNGIPRFVPEDNYAASFGMQWNRFRRTQLDSVSGVPISRDRFQRFTGWTATDLAGKRVLDVGCGAGRFAEIALEAGAWLVALDYSGAVDAARANLSSHEHLQVVQGDIFALPFALAQFDFVYCLGVLQHTPDVRRAFLSLPPMLTPGGKIAVDVYPWLLRNLAWSKYWLRPITRRFPTNTLFHLVERATPAMLAVSRVITRLPVVGRYLRYLIPVVNYEGTYALTEAQLLEWAVLDTFDMLAPAHDHPQRQSTLAAWLAEAGLDDRVTERVGFFVGRGTRPHAAVGAPEEAGRRARSSR